MSVDEQWQPLPPDGAAGLPAPAAYRAIQILDALSAARRPLTVTELAVRVPLAKSSTSNLLTTLEATGVVRRLPTGWVLGYKALEIGQSVLDSTDLVSEFRRTVATLPTLATETVLLAILEDADVLYLARHDGQQRVRLASDVGRRLPAPVTSLGKAMLASLPPAELESLLGSIDELPRATMRSHRTKAALRKDLSTIRTRGYAIDDEENTIGVTCFGVALPGAVPPTAVSTTFVTQRLTPAFGDAVVRELQALANRLGVLARA
jgi:IclR family transcriptional regulator, blcABC operon repressor